jgi:hypothetical protein
VRDHQARDEPTRSSSVSRFAARGRPSGDDVGIVVAAAAITGSPWLLVAGLAGHGFKDLWQHRTHFVANTRWWPPFCMIVDWVVAAIIVGEIAAGMHFD